MDRKSILKKVRPEYLLVLLLAAACVYTLYSSFAKTKEEKTTYSYTESLEEKLSKALSKVEGAAKVTVVITVSGGAETVIAEDKTVTTENGITIEKTSPVLVGGKPVVLRENNPVITGVLVVAKGADRFDVKMALLDATTTVLGVTADKVQILAQ